MDTFIIDLSIFEQRFKKESNKTIDIIYSNTFDEQHQRKQLMRLEELVDKYNQINHLMFLTNLRELSKSSMSEFLLNNVNNELKK